MLALIFSPTGLPKYLQNSPKSKVAYSKVKLQELVLCWELYHFNSEGELFQFNSGIWWKNYSLNHFGLLLLSKDTFSEKFTFLLPDAPTMEPLKSHQLFFSTALFPESLTNSSSGRQWTRQISTWHLYRESSNTLQAILIFNNFCITLWQYSMLHYNIKLKTTTKKQLKKQIVWLASIQLWI